MYKSIFWQKMEDPVWVWTARVAIIFMVVVTLLAYAYAHRPPVSCPFGQHYENNVCVVNVSTQKTPIK